MSAVGSSGPRLGRVVFLGALLALAVVAGALGPQLVAVVTGEGGALARARRKFDTWRGYAQGSDPRIKRLVKNIGGPTAAKARK